VLLPGNFDGTRAPLRAPNDLVIVRHAILKKIDAEKGVKLVDIVIEPDEDGEPPHTRIGVLTLIDDTLIARSRFDLPWEFHLRHVHNEIDQMAEQFKAARLDYWGRGRTLGGKPEVQLAGTGLRGLWP
jgi:hypothetical protein